MPTTTENYDIVGSYNNQRIEGIDAERSVNLFEYRDPLGKKPRSLIYTSGLTNSGGVFGATTGGFRGQFVFLGNMYVVIGTDVYLVTPSLVISKLNSSPLTTAVGYVGIDANVHQIIFVDGQKGYIYDTTTTIFVQITDANFPTAPLDVCYLDGFFNVAAGGTNTFLLSSLNQGLVWSGVTGGSNTFTLAAGVSNLTLTTGSTVNYQIGTPITISGSTVAEIPNGNYFVVAVINGTVFRVSATLGGTAIVSVAGGAGTLTNNGQLQQGAITSHPGTIVACRTLHRRLFLFSQFFTEVWENAGIGTNLPFRRNNSLLMEYGTPAIGSITVGFDKMFFLSQDRDGLGAVMEVVGTQSVPVSTVALDLQLSEYAEIQQVADCRSFLIKENGIIFYRMNFTLANHTFIYNVTFSVPDEDKNKLWHEEEVLNHDRHLTQTHAYFNGINYVGNYKSPILYKVDNDNFTNNGETIRRMRIGRPIVTDGYQRRRVDRFWLDLLQGNVAQISQPGIPYVFLSLSKDGGQTFGYLVKSPMGSPGQRSFRTVWRKLGVVPRGQAFVPKIEFFDELPFIILGAAWSMEVLPE
jgi:hypothetical protein